MAAGSEEKCPWLLRPLVLWLGTWHPPKDRLVKLVGCVEPPKSEAWAVSREGWALNNNVSLKKSVLAEGFYRLF